jgi:hypothetical protein
VRFGWSRHGKSPDRHTPDVVDRGFAHLRLNLASSCLLSGYWISCQLESRFFRKSISQVSSCRLY